MSFPIIFGQNQSENNKLDKTIANTFTYDGTLKNSTSIIAPTIIVQGNPSLFASCNYMDIAAFDRKYFIDDITVMAADIVEIKGRVDVLSSYADAIRQNTAILLRQENKWNLYLNDGSFSVYQNEITITKRVGSGPLPFGSYNYVLTVAGG